MKKIFLFFYFCLSLTPVWASGVGYIDYEKIFNNYKYAQNSALEIQQKETEFRNYLNKKEEEYNKLETPLQRQKFEAAAQKEIAATEKNLLDALLDSRCVFSGGTDITDTVINKLNEHIKWKSC